MTPTRERPPSAADQSPPDEVTEISVWSYINILLRWRLLMVGVPLALALGTIVWTLWRPREFEAQASFVSQDPQSAQSNLGQLASQFGLATPRNATSSPEFYVDLLQSREMMRDALLTEYSGAGKQPFRGTLIQLFRVRGRDTTEVLLRGLDKLSEGMTVLSDRPTGIVTFTIRTESPVLSVAIAARFLALLDEYNLKRRQSQARAEREFVEKQVEEARQHLREAEESVTAFLLRNREYTNSPVLLEAHGRLGREVQLRQELYLSLNQSFQTARIEEVRNTPVITVIEHPETLVEPVRRHLIRKTLTALVLGGVLAIGLAFIMEFLRKSARGDLPDYRQFVSLREQAFGGKRQRAAEQRRA
ncbi:MAG: hypothetical protein ACREL3_08520 [Gemmatimonadales bacterium]